MRKLIFVLLIVTRLQAQQVANPIITAFPSLRIPASSRGLSMGDVGIASAEENQALWYNMAKTAFAKNFHQASVVYTPYLSGITNDVKFFSANYLTTLSNTSTFGVAVNYLTMGWQATRDENGATVALYRNSEYSLACSYALQVAASGSMGLTLKLLGSQPAQFQAPAGYNAEGRSLFSAAADLSYYTYIAIGGDNRKLHIGAILANLGPKISIAGNDQKVFLPTNLGLGLSYTAEDNNQGSCFTAALDLNKLLVPTPALYDVNGQITGGKSASQGMLSGLFGSFGDAPGGFKEEMQEVRVSAGLEYLIAQQFALRSGVSLESRYKGNRRYMGFGVGYKGITSTQSWGLDFHYLVPFGATAAVSPFQNSWGFTLKMSIGNFE